MKKGMIVEIRDGEHSYEYSKMNNMTYYDGKLLINYQDDQNVTREEIGAAPDEIIFHPYHVEEEGDEDAKLD